MNFTGSGLYSAAKLVSLMPFCAMSNEEPKKPTEKK